MEPTLHSWIRLEPQARSENPTNNLKSEIRDALWLLTRQWQFGEMQGEDAGSAVFARMHYLHAPIEKVVLSGGEPQSLPRDYPLETKIEATKTALDLNLRIEMGRHWIKLLQKRLPANSKIAVIDAFKSGNQLKFQHPATSAKLEQYYQADLLTNEDLHQLLHSAVRTELLDGGKLYFDIKGGKSADTFLDTPNEKVNQIGQEFVQWFDRVYTQPSEEMNQNPAWHDGHLEHQFEGIIPTDKKQPIYLSAEEYYGNQLDWYSLDYKKTKVVSSNDEHSASFLIKHQKEVIPTPVKFAGMPHQRWWTIEEDVVNFGNIASSKTDVSKMIFAEFGLIYGNDWFVLPLTLPVGEISELEKITILDSFGQLTEVKHTQQMKPNEPWAFFQTYDATFPNEAALQNDNRLLIPPNSFRHQEGKPIEEILFIRDEMANMVWGIEKIIPDGMGNGIDGFESGLCKKAFLASLAEPKEQQAPLENEAQIKYQIATLVPENWIPFIPVKVSNEKKERQSKLQRAAMPRILNGLPTTRIRPRTTQLQIGLNQTTRKPYYIFDEEIPRSGTIIRLRWKRARTADGKVVLWLGREKTNGKGEGNSSLEFDRIRDKK